MPPFHLQNVYIIYLRKTVVYINRLLYAYWQTVVFLNKHTLLRGKWPRTLISGSLD